MIVTEPSHIIKETRGNIPQVCTSEVSLNVESSVCAMSTPPVKPGVRVLLPQQGRCVHTNLNNLG